MTWFKVDDKFWSHPRTSELSDGATALWIRAGSWSAGHLTDGFIPVAALRLFRARSRSVAELVDAGLWSGAGEVDGRPGSGAEGGYVFRDWGDYQPSKEQIVSKREATKNRVNTWRDKQSNDVTNGVSNAYQPEDSNAVGNAAPDPTRPDPTLEEAKASSRRKPETAISDNWAPAAAALAYARENKLDVLREAEQFRGHALTHDRRVRNWDMAFRTWLGKAQPSVPAKPDPNAWMNAPRAGLRS